MRRIARKVRSDGKRRREFKEDPKCLHRRRLDVEVNIERTSACRNRKKNGRTKHFTPAESNKLLVQVRGVWRIQRLDKITVNHPQ